MLEKLEDQAVFDVSGHTRMAFTTDSFFVKVFDGATNSIIGSVTAAMGPSYVAVNPVTNRIYVSNRDSANVSVIDGNDAAVSGRVLTSDGRGLRNATISITNPQGNRQITTTSSSGFYTFNNVFTGAVYIIRPRSRFFRFNTASIQIKSNVSNVDFTSLE